MTLEGIACLVAGFTARSVALAITSCDHTATRSRLTSKSLITPQGLAGAEQTAAAVIAAEPDVGCGRRRDESRADERTSAFSILR